MGKSIFKPGDTVAGIKILAVVVERSKHSSYARYLVRYSCEHESTVSGSGIVRRRQRKKMGFESTLCKDCSKKNAAEAKLRTNPRKRPDPPTKAEWEWSFLLMNQALFQYSEGKTVANINMGPRPT